MSIQMTVRKSRATNGSKSEKGAKFTFVLPPAMAQQLREAVEKGVAPSQNALVREALRREMKRLREAEIEKAYAAAAADPLYVQDLEECMRDFAELDRDALQHINDEPQTDEATS